MEIQLILALAGFSTVSSITPGPNNLMLLSSGVNFGFRPTIPHMLGISAGFAFLLFCVGMGLGQLFKLYPQAEFLLKIVGGSYLVYLAWRIANSGPLEKGTKRSRPMRFIEAAAFQWVNPKAWMMAISSMSAYTRADNYQATMWAVIIIFTLINLPCVSLWAGFGSSMRQFLANPVYLRRFNYLMALLLVASLWPMLK